MGKQAEKEAEKQGLCLTLALKHPQNLRCLFYFCQVLVYSFGKRRLDSTIFKFHSILWMYDSESRWQFTRGIPIFLPRLAGPSPARWSGA